MKFLKVCKSVLEWGVTMMLQVLSEYWSEYSEKMMIVEKDDRQNDKFFKS